MDRVETMSVRLKAQEAAKGGPLGNECNAAGVLRSWTQPCGLGPVGLHGRVAPPCLGATQAASARLALETNRPERDHRATNIHSL